MIRRWHKSHHYCSIVFDTRYSILDTCFASLVCISYNYQLFSENNNRTSLQGWTLSFCSQWPEGPVDLGSYWPDWPIKSQHNYSFYWTKACDIPAIITHHNTYTSASTHMLSPETNELLKRLKIILSLYCFSIISY